MVVRLWIESPDVGLRARLTYSLDLNDPEQTSEAAGSAEEVMRIVHNWVEAFRERTN